MDKTAERDRRDRGWVSAHRSIQHHWLWNDRPFAYGQAWLDLILLAQYEEQKFVLDKPKMLIVLPRGAVFTSQSELARRWGWSRKKVCNFLELLEQDEMIASETAGRGTILKLLNYGHYQDFLRDAQQPSSTKGTEEAPDKGGKGTEEAPDKSSKSTEEAPDKSGKGTEEAPDGNTFKQEKQGKPEEQGKPSESGEQGKPPKQSAAPSACAVKGSLPDWAADLSVRPVSVSDLEELVVAGASHELIRWAASLAAGKGKGWAYVRGIVRNSLQKGMQYPPSSVPRPLSRPSYDPEEFDRRGFELPPLPSLSPQPESRPSPQPESRQAPQSDMERYGWTDADFYLPPLPGKA